ncbi:MAG: LCP family protein [bacterium]|nr:LCP family protein [bacterium]
MGRNEDFEDELSRMRERKSRGRSRAASANSSATKKGETGSRQASGRMDHKDVERSGSKSSAGKRKPKRSKKKTALRVVIILIEVIILLGIAAYAYVASKFNLVQRVEDFKPENIVNLELTPEQKEVMEGYKTVAIFGVDARDSTIDKGTHSDVIMICNIDMGTGEIKLVSVFRDTYLNINDKNSYRKINAAYFDGGPTQAVKALNKNLDLNIEDYITFNWTSVIHAINILDGVDIEINSKELHYLNAFITETVKATGIGSTQIQKTGVVHMDGVQAVAYGRLRLMDSDYVRTERQKIVVKAAFEKAKKANLAKLNELAGNILADVSTSMDWSDAIPLIENISKFYLGDSLGFPMARGEMRYKGGDYVVPQTLESNVIELHQFLFANENYEPTSTLKKISTHIAQVSGFTKPGKNAGSVVIGGDSSSTKSTAAASKTTAAKDDGTKESSTKETTKENESDKKTTAEGDESSRTDETERENVPGESGSASHSTKNETHSSGAETTSEAGNSSSPGRPSHVTVSPSESNGDLIHQEPTKATTAPGIYEEPGKTKESTEGGTGNGLTPGGSSSAGGQSTGNGGAIITDKSPSDVKGQTTAAPAPEKTTAAESSSSSGTNAAENKTGNTSNANPLNPNPAGNTGNSQSPGDSGTTAPSAPSAPSSAQREPGSTTSSNTPGSNSAGSNTPNPAAPGSSS